VQRLKQAIPGQLGQLTRRMANAGINIEVLYSDHDHQLILFRFKQFENYQRRAA
jgi:hypothetical protein